jgi:thioredoxin-dependent peroxiredoxin
MQYQSPFEDWYTYSTVHKPLPDFTCETGLVLFPPELVPGVGHPLVDKLGNHAVRRLTMRKLELQRVYREARIQSRNIERQPPAERPRSVMTTRRSEMTLRINSEAPNFTAETTEGVIDFHQWIGNGWAILFSHPKDFTPVCTTELGYMARLKPEFDKRNCKIIGLSVDPVGNHSRWVRDIEETQGYAVNYPMIGDPELKVAKLYDMLPEEAGNSSEGRTAADNAPVRAVFFVNPEKKIKAMLTYPMTSGRNFDEVLRLLDSLQLTAAAPVATPVNWTKGDDVIIVPAVSDEQAREKFPGGWRAPKPYLRIVPQPNV